MTGHVEFSCIQTIGITSLKHPVDFRVVDEIQVIESKWAKAVGRQFFLDGNFVFITFLPAVIICLPALCLALTGCVCTFYPGFPFLFTAISAPGLLVLLNHSELLVSCWVALKKYRILTSIPAKSPSPLPS